MAFDEKTWGQYRASDNVEDRRGDFPWHYLGLPYSPAGVAKDWWEQISTDPFTTRKDRLNKEMDAQPMGMFSNFNRPMPPGVGRRPIWQPPEQFGPPQVTTPWVDPLPPENRPWVNPPAPLGGAGGMQGGASPAQNASSLFGNIMASGGFGSEVGRGPTPLPAPAPQAAPPVPLPPMRPPGLGEAPQAPPAQSPWGGYDAFSRGDNPWRADGGQAIDDKGGNPGDGMKAFANSGAFDAFKRMFGAGIMS